MIQTRLNMFSTMKHGVPAVIQGDKNKICKKKKRRSEYGGKGKKTLNIQKSFNRIYYICIFLCQTFQNQLNPVEKLKRSVNWCSDALIPIWEWILCKRRKAKNVSLDAQSWKRHAWRPAAITGVKGSYTYGWPKGGGSFQEPSALKFQTNMHNFFPPQCFTLFWSAA